MNDVIELPEKLSIIDLLAMVQQELKAPKGQYNAFGKYKYRSCEDIVEAVKPLLAKQSAVLIMTDSIVMMGDRHYIKAEVVIRNKDESITAVGLAREPADRKGMDASQITGTASSYARKYALNGLFAIDDAKDSDTQEGPTKRINKETLQKSIAGILDAIEKDDDLAAKQLVNELNPEEQSFVWQQLSSKQKKVVKELVHRNTLVE